MNNLKFRKIFNLAIILVLLNSVFFPSAAHAQTVIVQTNPANGITKNSATVVGSYKFQTPPPNTYTWFRYGTNRNSMGSTSQGIHYFNISEISFNETVTGLAPSTTYYFQAFAKSTNEADSHNGGILSFTTLADPSAATNAPPSSAPSNIPAGNTPIETQNTPAPVLTTSGVVVCTENCGFNELIRQIQKIISFLLFDMAIPLAAIIFTYAGFKFMTSGANPGERTKAKGMFMNVLIGLTIALAAWLIINTILTTLLNNPSNTEYNLLKNPTQ